MINGMGKELWGMGGLNSLGARRGRGGGAKGRNSCCRKEIWHKEDRL